MRKDWQRVESQASLRAAEKQSGWNTEKHKPQIRLSAPWAKWKSHQSTKCSEKATSDQGKQEAGYKRQKDREATQWWFDDLLMICVWYLSRERKRKKNEKKKWKGKRKKKRIIFFFFKKGNQNKPKTNQPTKTVWGIPTNLISWQLTDF